MTELLERAVKKVQTLSDSEHDTIASMILEEIEDDAMWQKRALVIVSSGFLAPRRGIMG
ncbi:hypothetical protein CCP4SC76_5880005 [Gammaproteobacteria bacterium]